MIFESTRAVNTSGAPRRFQAAKPMGNLAPTRRIRAFATNGESAPPAPLKNLQAKRASKPCWRWLSNVDLTRMAACRPKTCQPDQLEEAAEFEAGLEVAVKPSFWSGRRSLDQTVFRRSLFDCPPVSY